MTTTAITHISSPQSEEMITSFINSHPQGVLTTLNVSEKLQGSVINIFNLDNYQFAFMTRKDSRKYKNLQKNAHMSFVTFDPFSRTEAEIEGIAELVEDEAQTKEILDVISEAAKLGKWHISPYVSTDDDYALFIIYPKKIHMTTYWEKDSGMEAFHESLEFELSTGS